VGIAVLACGGLSVVLSIAAIVLGALGRRPGNATNCGAATAGMVSGIVTLGLNFCCMMLGALVLLLGVRGFR
jgi:hypothetical protein